MKPADELVERPCRLLAPLPVGLNRSLQPLELLERSAVVERVFRTGVAGHVL